MPVTLRRHRDGGGAERCEVGDLDAEFLRASREIFPAQRARPLRLELVFDAQWIVAVDEDEMVADRQFLPGFDDQRMLDGTVEFAHVHHFVRADFVFCGQFF